MTEQSQKDPDHKPVARSSPHASDNSESNVVVHGGIHAQRDVIMHDQYNYQDQRVAQIQTPAEFVAELQKLQAEITALKQQPGLTSAHIRNIEIVEGQVEEVTEEAGQPQPLGERIKTILTEAKETMELISGNLQTAANLGATLGGLAMLATKLFGG